MDEQNGMNATLPQAMQQHTYAIMYRVEGSHWWFAGRRRILQSFMRDLAPQSRQPVSAVRILDVGCGTGANLELLAQFGEAEGVDGSDAALEYCRARGLTRVQKGLAEALPYAEGEFDLVTALDVLEHLDNDVAGLREMWRVLRPGGRVLLFVPAFMWLWGIQDDISRHRIRYRRKQIAERITRAGFAVERATYANITFFLPILAGRALMKLTGLRPASENNINVSALNGVFGQLLGAERFWLKRLNLPFGVSVICVARKISPPP